VHYLVTSPLFSACLVDGQKRVKTLGNTIQLVKKGKKKKKSDEAKPLVRLV